MTAWALFLVSWLLRPGAIALTLALAVVVGAFRPPTPLVGFVGSFVTGQYPVYCSVVSVLGMGLGVLVWRVGRGVSAPSWVASRRSRSSVSPSWESRSWAWRAPRGSGSQHRQGGLPRSF